MKQRTDGNKKVKSFNKKQKSVETDKQKKNQLLKKQIEIVAHARSSVRGAIRSWKDVKFSTLLLLSQIVRVPLKKKGVIITEYKAEMINPLFFENIDEILQAARIEVHKLEASLSKKESNKSASQKENC